MNELLLGNLLRSLTIRRVFNIVKSGASFGLSALTGKTIVWGLPPVLTIEPTNICNLRCPLCTTGAGEMERANGKMDLNTFQNIIEKMGDEIFFLLIYHQGEPYINGHFFDFVRLAKSKYIYTTTSTNGHYFTEENIQKTIESGLDSMIVSLDGVTQASYEKYRVKGKLDKVLSGTKQLMAAKKAAKSRTPNVALQFLVMKHNEHEIPQVKKLAKELGVDRLLIKNIEVRSYAEALEWLPQNEDFQRYELRDNDFIVRGVSEKQSCPRPWTSTLINWDGTFVPCCFDKNGQYDMGNVNANEAVDEIWNGQAYKEFRKRLLQDRKQIDICRNCNQGFGSFLPEKLWKRKKSNSTQKKESDLPILNQ